MSNIKNSIVESDAHVEEMYLDYLKGESDSAFLKCGTLSIHVMNHHRDLVTLAVSTPETSTTHHLTVKSARALAEAITGLLGGE